MKIITDNNNKNKNNNTGDSHEKEPEPSLPSLPMDPDAERNTLGLERNVPRSLMESSLESQRAQ